MPAPPQRQQQLHGAGGDGGGHIGLESQLPDPQIGGDHQVRQLPGQAVVIVGEGVGDHQPLAVGAIAAAVGEKAAEPGILPGKVGRPGVHDPQAEALDLFRPKAHARPTGRPHPGWRPDTPPCTGDPPGLTARRRVRRIPPAGPAGRSAPPAAGWRRTGPSARPGRRRPPAARPEWRRRGTHRSGTSPPVPPAPLPGRAS